jgi:uncharacterized membrane protein YphA (DoxX/SURF4 family)
MTNPGTTRTGTVLFVIARWALGGLFIYMGLSKALHPVEFLKQIRQYDLLHHHLALNLVASILPWLEMFCGVLLALGVAVRGVALVLVAMLIPFTTMVLIRALHVQEATHLAFCAIKFDCGCGAGEVFICRKLAENVLLTGISIALIFWRDHRLCVRPTLLKEPVGEAGASTTQPASA